MRVLHLAAALLMISFATTPVQARFMCRSQYLLNALSDHRTAAQSLEDDLKRHKSSLKNVFQPLKGVLEVLGGELAVTGRGIEALGRTTLTSFHEIQKETTQGGACFMQSMKEYQLTDGLQCLFISGGQLSLLTTGTIKAGIKSAEFVVVKGSDVFFDSLGHVSDDFSYIAVSKGSKSLTLPFDLLSGMIQVGRWALNASVQFVSQTVSLFLDMIGQIFCNMHSSMAFLAHGQIKQFFSVGLVGTIQTVVKSSDKLISHTLLKPLVSLGHVFRKRADETQDPPQKGPLTRFKNEQTPTKGY